MGEVGAGWYRDPENHRQLRYHDGVSWTARAKPVGEGLKALSELPDEPLGWQQLVQDAAAQAQAREADEQALAEAPTESRRAKARCRNGPRGRAALSAGLSESALVDDDGPFVPVPLPEPDARAAAAARAQAQDLAARAEAMERAAQAAGAEAADLAARAAALEALTDDEPGAGPEADPGAPPLGSEGLVHGLGATDSRAATVLATPRRERTTRSGRSRRPLSRRVEIPVVLTILFVVVAAAGSTELSVLAASLAAAAVLAALCSFSVGDDDLDDIES